MKGIADLLGRIFLSTIFIYEVFDTIFFYNAAQETMTNFGVTWMQDTLLIVVLMMMGIGAFLVVIGYFARVGATLLLLVWIPFTFIVYSFWNDPPDLQRISMLYFMRNLAVIGGLLLLLANGSGEYSVRRLIMLCDYQSKFLISYSSKSNVKYLIFFSFGSMKSLLRR